MVGLLHMGTFFFFGGGRKGKAGNAPSKVPKVAHLPELLPELLTLLCTEL